MFGNVIPNQGKLTDDDMKKYRAVYCGLCKSLTSRSKILSPLTLNYDITFLALILISVYEGKTENVIGNCVLHPIKKSEKITGELIDYAADMNIILSYLKFLDDYNDDKNIFAYLTSAAFKNQYSASCLQYQSKADKIKYCLSELKDIEDKNILDPDAAAGCFGRIMEEVFSPYNDDKEPFLKEFGNALGKVIYILDACIDLNSDVKHKRYNPLVMFSKHDFKDLLNILMADCISCYNKLKIKENTSLIENILFSGIWTAFEFRRKKESKHK